MSINLSIINENVSKMLKERNYTLLLGSNLNDCKYFYNIERDEMLIVCYIPILSEKLSINKEQIVNLIEKMLTEDTIILHCIIITDYEPHHDVSLLIKNPKKEINKILSSKHKKLSKNAQKIFLSLKKDINFELFLSKYLMFNLIEHRLVPLHQKLSEKEKIDLFKVLLFKPEYNPLDKLPKMLKTDAICKYYNWEIGDVIKITRTIPNRSIYYRVIVAPMLN